MSKPLVSVVVPVHNGALYLREALESVFAQDYPAHEVIVIDDGSTDGSAQIALSFSRLRHIFQENEGAPAARNRGIHEAQGNILAFIDQDDIWTPNKLTLQVACLLDNPELRYVVARQQYFFEGGVEPPKWFRDEIAERSRLGYLPGTLVARREVFDELGLFDSAFPVTSDVDWFFRAKDAKIPMAIVPEILLHKRVHEAAHSSQAAQHNRELLSVLKRSVQRQRDLASRDTSEGDS